MIKSLAGVFRPGGLEITAALVRLCSFRPGARVLDVGCGIGRTVAYLAEKHGLRAVGVDADAARVAMAGGNVPAAGVLLARGECLPFPDGVFDGVFAECSLSVMNYDAAVLREIRRVLKPGGKLAVSDLYVRTRPKHKRPAAACFRGARTQDALRDLLAGHGFELTAWQDASGCLKEFVAAYIMAHGCPGECWRTADKRAFGYFFLVAEKSAAI